MIVLLSIVAIICGLTIAMVVEERKQKHKMIERMKRQIKNSNEFSRLDKWRRLAIKWKEELKKPVKVEFT